MKDQQLQNDEPLLAFEFASSTGEIIPYLFKDPLEIIEAYTFEDVLTGLDRIQDAINQGYYAAGFLSYESAPAFHQVLKVKNGNTMPLLWFGIFSEPDHAYVNRTRSFSLSDWQPDVSQREYRTAISQIKNAIKKGITYQTNYTLQLNARFQGDAISLFTQMKNAQAANYSAYIHTGEFSVISASPELFFHLKDNVLTTKPMKGTVKRGKTFEEDREKAEWLYQSEKNRAENIMIVDLLRNDLGMIAEIGTVHVEKLFEIEPYPTVHQMTSTIKAKLKSNTKFVDIFKAIFPCGSITGAPKASTMKIIAELEKAPREVYCGTIGFITPDKEAIFNVPIRTIIIDNKSGKATYGVGGGITWDSTAEDEYNEVLAKSSILEVDFPEFQLLESILLENGKYFLPEEHLERMKKSAAYFQFHFDEEKIKQSLYKLASDNGQGLYKVRLLLEKNGDIFTEIHSIGLGQTGVKSIEQADSFMEHVAPSLGERPKIVLADKPIEHENIFYYHKTTNRKIYSQFQSQNPDIFDVLLWNKDMELTEFINGNVVLEIDGKLWTPPVKSGLLAGTYRGFLLKQGKISEKTLKLADLNTCTKIWLINSVRKWVEVERIESK
ncbi:aminodeoxychorismate synthase component I [Caldibacillus thermoamylovorans]|uniref:aminodeoxychorismate synthase component I n=1 Tax=Caldibacillus thermoamylovorans TaxID=35841 RepID=UPI001D068C10|nr:aminodeoxychorismate synthase component I [Caldibacillus thermoamylovorans]MCB5936667.1 aminodeoxychorismate synthase component I [Bacillus sp. DFI.2.34]MCB7078392.1 aminodeoxychorismate synthase component I [Caldibacillus thermoamylovorans]